MSTPDEKHRLSFPGLNSVYGYVTVDGQPLEVYGAKVEGSTAVGYIEAMEGKQFEVVYVEQRRWHEVLVPYSMRVYVDGTRAKGSVFQATDSLFSKPANSTRRRKHALGHKTSPTTLLPFKFSTLQTTEDDDAVDASENFIKALGTVRIDYNRVKNVRYSAPRTNYAPVSAAKVHEQSKKAALTHQAGYGAPVATTAGNSTSYEKLDKVPLMSIEFRYRSRRLLELEELIPPLPNYAVDPPAPLDPALHPAAGPSKPNARFLALKAQIDSEAAAQVDVKPRTVLTLDDSEDEDEPARKKPQKEDADEVERQKAEDRKKGKKPQVLDLCDSD